MKLLQLSKRSPVSPIAVAAVEATNNRRAVLAVRRFLRDVADDVRIPAWARTAAEDLLDATTESKIRGRIARRGDRK